MRAPASALRVTVLVLRAAGIAMTLPAIAMLAVAIAAERAMAQSTHFEWTALRYEATLLDDDSDAWHWVSAEAGARRTRLSGVARVNWASRFGSESWQIEADAYPALPGVGYAYLSAAWAPDGPFPRLRLAGEAYVTLPNAFEASLGGIHLDFQEVDVPIIMGSIGKYLPGWWLAARSYWLPEGDELSVTLIGRRYLRAADEFVTLRLVSGTSPDNLQTAGDASRLRSWGAYLDAQLPVSGAFLVLPMVGMTDEELTADRGRVRTSLGLGVMYRF